MIPSVSQPATIISCAAPTHIEWPESATATSLSTPARLATTLIRLRTEEVSSATSDTRPVLSPRNRGPASNPDPCSQARKRVIVAGQKYAVLHRQRNWPWSAAPRPVHPRTRARLQQIGLDATLTEAGVRLLEPLPYVAFMSLLSECAVVITDSGGVQEETTYLGIPCLTLRPNTERPVTITHGTNRLAKAESLAQDVEKALSFARAQHRVPDLWDGRTANRCLEDLRSRAQAHL
jgi:hypothetical protein